MAVTIGQLTGIIDLDDQQFSKGVDSAEREFDSFGDRIGTRGQLIGAAAGAALAAGIGTGVAQNLQMETATAQLQAQLGTTAAESERLGAVAGNLFSNAYAASVGEAGDAVRAVMQNVEGMADASAGEIESVTGEVLSLASTMRTDVGSASAAVGQMIRSGLADSPREAMDVMTAATQQGANRLDDLGDTVNEYSTNFRTLGLSGQQAMGLITQAMDNGARSSDQAADALKEFSIRAAEGSTQAEEGFEAIGLSAADMADKIGQGGPAAAEALDLTLRKLQEMPPGADKAAASIALFGTQGEDMAGALNGMDLSGAVGALGDVEGASGKADEALQNTSQKTLDGLVNSFKQAAASATELPGPLGVAAAGATQFGGAALSTLAPLGMMMAAQRSASAAARASAATQAASGATVRRGWLRTGTSAVVNAAKIAASWIATGVAATATAAGSMARAVAATVAGWARMAGAALRNAARMAASWFIAMGPVGWIIGIVIGLVALIIANWDKVKAWTTQAWTATWEFIKGAWQWIVDSVSSGITNVINWVKGLPGRILGALGDLGNLLWDAGKDIMRGLWNGIKSMASWVGSKIKGMVRSVVPGPVADVLGIASPSKVMADMGRWIPEGLAQGIDRHRGAVQGASARMAGDVSRTRIGTPSAADRRARSTGAGSPGVAELREALAGMSFVLDDNGGRVMARAVNRANASNRRR